jgi:two-component sensor histidine kinase
VCIRRLVSKRVALQERPVKAPAKRPTVFPPTPGPESDPRWALQRLQALEPYAILDTAPEQSFDDIAYLAAAVCDAPTALVSLVDHDRQWFKAKVGFEGAQTGLESSVCRFALAEPDLLVIEDLSLDARTRTNPLVADAPHIRFYAGAPLRPATGGEPLGSLCVIDTQPRPGGLTDGQRESLRRLARLVVQQMEMRRVVHERDARLSEQRALSETQRLVARAGGDPDAIMRAVVQGVMTSIPTAEGVAVEMVEGDEIVYRCVGGTLSAHAGLRLPMSGSLAGRCARTGESALVRDVDDDAHVSRAHIALLGLKSAICTPVWRGDRIVGAVKAQAAEVDVFSLRDLGLLTLFAQTATAAFAAASEAAAIKALQLSEQRHRALLELGDRLRDTDSAARIAAISAEIMGRELGASLTGYGAVDPRAETVTIESTQKAPDAAGLETIYAFRDFGGYIEELKAGALVIVSDVETDRRTQDNAARFRAMGIRTFVNVPVMERGELVAIMLVHFAKRHLFTADDAAFVRTVADRARAGIARLRMSEHQSVLNREISHRLKNTLAMVQAIAGQTLKGVRDRELVDAFGQRLLALSTAHDLLLANDWSSAELADVVRQVTANLGAEERVAAGGPEIDLGARATLSTSLLVHELATNALKYGALSAASGRVEVRWTLDGAMDDPVLTLSWREHGGPTVAPPGRAGFGSRLLKMGLIGTGGSTLSYEPNGFSATFTASLRQAQAA